MCPSSQVRRSGGLAPSSSSGPRLAQPLCRLSARPTAGYYCLSRSTSIIFGYSPPGQPPKQSLGGLEKLFLWCEDQGIQSQTGLRVCPSPPLRSRAVEKAERRQGPRRGLQGASQVTMAY